MIQQEDILIRPAVLDDLDVLVPLFDAYRVFYKRDSDEAACRAFLRNRMERRESHILLAFRGNRAVGFTQLYPSFSSASIARVFILNDLFVVPEKRRAGVGARLLQAAAELGRANGAIRLNLSTAVDNHAAQAAYEKAGWRRTTDYCEYQLKLDCADPYR